MQFRKIKLYYGKKKPRVKARFKVLKDQTVNARLIYPTVPVLGGFQTYAQVEGTVVSIPMYRHTRSSNCSW